MTWLDSHQIEYLRSGALNAAGVLNPAKRLLSPHGLYAYPARFSPHFASRAIESISRPGEIVLDPFMGSGTTLIEALKLGRRSVGLDISPISKFLTDRIFRETEQHELMRAKDVGSQLIEYLRKKGPKRLLVNEALLRRVNLAHSDTLEIGAVIDFWIQEAQIEGSEAGRLLRAFVLSAGQWALDGKKEVPSFDSFLDRLEKVKDTFPYTILSFGQTCRERWGTKTWHQFVETRVGDATQTLPEVLASVPRFDSVVTSPPYPGVHMLYGKWQIRGRRETTAPQWIVGAKDLQSDSSFTMGSRHGPLSGYFEGIKNLFSEAHKRLKPSSMSIHMIGFNNPKAQLATYVDAMQTAGFQELLHKGTGSRDGRIWRRVPGRKFYAESSVRAKNTAREVVMIFERL
jgi:hypothetical protein